MWISTSKGLHTLSVTDHLEDIKFQRVNIRNYNDRIRDIKTVFQDKKSNYWLGSFDKGIHILSKNLNYIGSLKRQNKFNLKVDANALYDLKIIDSHYWLATDNGLYIIDDRYKLVSHITKDPSNDTKNQTLSSNIIRAISQYDENNVWLATKNGLDIINLFNNKIKNYQSNKSPTSISEDWLMDVYQDTNNNMWLASYGGGLSKHSPITNLFNHSLIDIGNKNYRVESFAETSDSTVWFSTEQQGLFKINTDGQITKENTSIKENIW